MNILIIGSKGFIGENCLNFFENTKHNVYGCDVVNDYVSKNYFLIDTVNSDFNKIFESCTFDFCINCAGSAQVSASISDPLRDFTLNAVIVFKLLDAIRYYQPGCRFINLSSAAVYGNPLYLPVDEKHSTNPISPYGYHKLAAESICIEFSKLFQIKTCSLRIFSAYGPGLQKQLFWDLFDKFKNEKAIVLYGTGNESRDFIYIADIIQAIDLIVKDYDFSEPVINLANGNEIFINYAVEFFYKNLNHGIKYEFNNQVRQGDPLNWKADISLLKSLDYDQKISFEQGVLNYIKWLKE